MKILSEKNYQNAEQFILTNARELEQNLYYYHFKPIMSSYQDVVYELAKFQNSDGGFGKALEPDIRMDNSSVVATKHALQILMDINAPSTEKMVKNGILFLLTHYNHKLDTWELVDQEVENAPHAPWWKYANLSKEFNQFQVNPKAGILRIFLYYYDLVPEELISKITASLMNYFNQQPLKMDFFDVIGFLQLLQAPNLNESNREIIEEKLNHVASSIIPPNPDEWLNSIIKPIWLAPSPNAPLYNTLKVFVHNNLDLEIINQQEDGSWNPAWNWNNKWKKEWSQAKKEWQGVLTLAMLRIFRDFDRIEGLSYPKPSFNFKYPLD